MFLNFFGLREQPFGVTPDPRYLYQSPTHREALASLAYGIEVGRGFMGLIAEPGMGKTTILFQLLQSLGNSARTIFLFQTQCDARDFIRSLLADLGMDDAGGDMVRMHGKLNEVLLQETQAGRRFVLVVDEAQNLDNSVLEVVRMLSNFETPRAKLMQIVLAGQPQLAEKLAHPSMAQLRQRVSILAKLHPFDAEETSAYIDYRLSVAGYDGPSLLSPEACTVVAQASGGIPRNINNLCFNSMSLACATGQKTIAADIVWKVLSGLALSPLTADTPGALDAAPQLTAGSEGVNPGTIEARREAMPSPAVPPQEKIKAPGQALLASGGPTQGATAAFAPLIDASDPVIRADSEISLRFSNQIQPDSKLGSRFRLPRLPYIHLDSTEDARSQAAAHAASMKES